MRYLRIEPLRDATGPPTIPRPMRLATGEPSREIGFSAAGEPIVLGPVGSNVGVLVDACDDWSTSTADAAEAAAHFDATWSALWPRFAHLDDR